MFYFSPGIYTSNVAHCCREFNAIHVSLPSYNTLYILLWSFQIHTHTHNTSVVAVNHQYTIAVLGKEWKNTSTAKDRESFSLSFSGTAKQKIIQKPWVTRNRFLKVIRNHQKGVLLKILQHPQFSTNSVRRELSFESLVPSFAYQGFSSHRTSMFKFVSCFETVISDRAVARRLAAKRVKGVLLCFGTYDLYISPSK